MMIEDLEPAGEGDWVVEPGDSIVSIAVRSGHAPDTIWNDPANAALKETRKDPEILLPGDRVTVMPLRPKSLSCATGKRHVFRRAGVPAMFTVVMEDETGEPFAGKRYELEIEGRILSGQTDDAGRIACPIPPASTAGTLRVWIEEPGFPDPLERQLVLSSLYPVQHPLGLQQRLFNLGFYSGPIDGKLSDQTQAAALAFAAAQEIAVTDDNVDAMLAKLVEVHKS